MNGVPVNENLWRMQKLYLLLRNNDQKGPYTIDELLQQQLRPTDLVWVQGCSQAWLYPSEVADLEPYFGKKQDVPDAAGQQPTQQKMDAIEQRAEELKRIVLSANRHFVSPKKDDDGDEIATEVLRNMAQQQIEFIDHRKKESPLLERLSAIMVMVTVVAGVYGGTKFFIAGTNLPAVVITKAMSTDSHAAKIIPNPSSAPAPEQKKDTVTIAVVKPRPAALQKRKRRINTDALPATAIQRVAPPPRQEDETTLSLLQAAVDDTSKEIAEPEPKPIVTEEPVEKKKPFGLFKGLFKKKKKEGEKPAGQEGKTLQEQGN